MFDKIRDLLKPSGRSRQAPPADAYAVVDPFAGAGSESAPPRARPPDQIKGNIDHQGHFRALARNDEEVAKLCIDALAASRQKRTIAYGSDEVSGYLWGDSLLQVITVTKNGDVLTAYPSFSVGAPQPARITEIIECENGYEGQLQAYVDGGALTFFDTMYFARRNSYFPSQEARVLVAGIAYVMGRSRPAAEDDMLVRHEGGDVDDYVFRGAVRDTIEFSILGRKVRAVRTTARLSPDAKPLDLWICVTPAAGQERLSPGDRISGIVWLQGFIVP